MSDKVHELIIFNKTGLCLYHHDLRQSKTEGLLTGVIDLDNPSKKVTEKQKLLFGLIWSLKSWSSKVSCENPNQVFKNFSTSEFSLHFLEIPTGLKIILLTNPTTGTQQLPQSTKN